MVVSHIGVTGQLEILKPRFVQGKFFFLLRCLVRQEDVSKSIECRTNFFFAASLEKACWSELHSFRLPFQFERCFQDRYFEQLASFSFVYVREWRRNFHRMGGFKQASLEGAKTNCASPFKPFIDFLFFAQWKHFLILST